jgi:hypothetical protein
MRHIFLLLGTCTITLLLSLAGCGSGVTVSGSTTAASFASASTPAATTPTASTAPVSTPVAIATAVITPAVSAPTLTTPSYAVGFGDNASLQGNPGGKPSIEFAQSTNLHCAP